MGRRTIGQNNGRITQFSDSSTGEVVNYTYDSLNRLIAATTGNSSGPVWGESYTYDGFGNLLSKVPTQGTAPQVYTGVNSQTNQMAPADANGNAMWSNPSGLPFAWDVENRMVFAGATDSSSDWVTYSYDPWGKRVLQYATAGSASTVSTCVLYFYGVNGKRLGTYNCGYAYGQFTITTANVNVYFGKKLIASGSEMNQMAVFTDRLGSVRGQAFGAPIAYYPYGEERTSTPDNTDKFGTYFRDGYGQDYADQRYYTANFGRFWSPDPLGYRATDSKNPVTWNQYAYVNGDPVNSRDREGLFIEANPGGGGDDGGDSDFDLCMLYNDAMPGCGIPTQGQISTGKNLYGMPLANSIMRDEWYDALILADKMLAEASCAGLFGLTNSQLGNSSPSALTVLSEISNSYQFGPINSTLQNTVTSATTIGVGSNTISIAGGATMDVSAGVTILVNNTSQGASFVSGSTYDQAVTILHELGHAYWDMFGPGTSAIQPDGSGTPQQQLAQSQANTALITKDCTQP